MVLSQIGDKLKAFEDSRLSLIHSAYVCMSVPSPVSSYHCFISSPFPLALSLCLSYCISLWIDFDARNLIGCCCLEATITCGLTISLCKMCYHSPCAIHQYSHSSPLLYPRHTLSLSYLSSASLPPALLFDVIQISARFSFSGNHEFLHYSPVTLREVTQLDNIPKSVQHLHFGNGMKRRDVKG